MTQWIAAIARGHNSGVCLLKDGELVLSIEEERLSRKKSKDKKWLTKALLVSIRHKNKLYKRYRDKPLNPSKKLEYTRYKNKVTDIVRLAQKNYYTQLLLDEKFSMQNLWKVYRHLMGKEKNKNANLINKLVTDTEIVTGDKNIA